MDYSQIQVERRGAVCLVTLHRPDRMNAWTFRMSAEMADAFRTANDDPTIGAIVVTGAGRGFCAGADIEATFATPGGGAGQGEAETASWVDLCRSSKPLLAAINGAAIGVGLSMVLPFDRLVTTESAKLSMRFVRMGVVPELASTRFLVARCGWGPASWLSLSGETISGAEAGRLGLVDRVVPDGEALAATLADAELLAANPVPQMRMVKELLTANAVDSDLAAIQRRELSALQAAYRTAEHHEAVAAFMQKRPPVFLPRPD